MAINGFFIPFHSEFDDELEEVEETKENSYESQDDSEELEETVDESQDDSEELEETDDESDSQVDSISSERSEEDQESTEETEDENISQDDSDSESNETIAYTVSCNGYSIDFDSNSINCFLLASILGAVLCICFFGRLKTL